MLRALFQVRDSYAAAYTAIEFARIKIHGYLHFKLILKKKFLICQKVITQIHIYPLEKTFVSCLFVLLNMRSVRSLVL